MLAPCSLLRLMHNGDSLLTHSVVAVILTTMGVSSLGLAAIRVATLDCLSRISLSCGRDLSRRCNLPSVCRSAGAIGVRAILTLLGLATVAISGGGVARGCRSLLPIACCGSAHATVTVLGSRRHGVVAPGVAAGSAMAVRAEVPMVMSLSIGAVVVPMAVRTVVTLAMTLTIVVVDTALAVAEATALLRSMWT